jgi:uncharacterized protein (TIGR02996 family)
MHPDERAFRDRIIAEPDEDIHRLAYADWLEEHGRAPLAEFVRLQVQVRALKRSAPPYVKLTEKPQRCCKCQGFWAGTGRCGCPAGDLRSETIRRKLLERAAFDAELKALRDSLARAQCGVPQEERQTLPGDEIIRPARRHFVMSYGGT